MLSQYQITCAVAISKFKIDYSYQLRRIFLQEYCSLISARFQADGESSVATVADYSAAKMQDKLQVLHTCIPDAALYAQVLRRLHLTLVLLKKEFELSKLQVVFGRKYS